MERQNAVTRREEEVNVEACVLQVPLAKEAVRALLAMEAFEVPLAMEVFRAPSVREALWALLPRQGVMWSWQQEALPWSPPGVHHYRQAVSHAALHPS